MACFLIPNRESQILNKNKYLPFCLFFLYSPNKVTVFENITGYTPGATSHSKRAPLSADDEDHMHAFASQKMSGGKCTHNPVPSSAAST